MLLSKNNFFYLAAVWLKQYDVEQKRALFFFFQINLCKSKATSTLFWYTAKNENTAVLFVLNIVQPHYKIHVTKKEVCSYDM